MIVRDATEDDYDDLLRMGREFVAEAGRGEIDDDTLLMTLESLKEQGILKVCENGTVCGAAGALVFPHYWNRGEMIAQELFWWVDEAKRGTSAGLRLLVALENEARDLGAKELLMLCLERVDGDKVANMYERLGYEPLERTYTKEL